MLLAKIALFQGWVLYPLLEPKHPLNWQRVLRGGSWNNNQDNLRSANRNNNTTGNRNNNNGFRAASTLINRTSVFTEIEAGIESSGVLGKSTGPVGVLSFWLTSAGLLQALNTSGCQLAPTFFSVFAVSANTAFRYTIPAL